MSDTTPIDLEDLRHTSMTDDQYERFIRMEMNVAQLKKDTGEQFNNLRSIESKMDTLLAQVAAGKMSWKILTGLGAAALAIIAAIPWLATHVKLGP